MDIYIVKLFSEGFPVPKLEFSSDQSRGSEAEISLPYIESILKQRKGAVYGVSLQLFAEIQKPCTTPSWNCLGFEKTLLKDDDVVRTSNDLASNILLKLSDELPAPGSYLLNVIWDMRAVKTANKISESAALLGAVKKLCCWHFGQLHVYVDPEAFISIRHLIAFMDPLAKISEVADDTCIAFQWNDRTLWRGSLDVLMKDASIHRIFGLTLYKPCRPKPKILVNTRAETNKTPSSSNDSFKEDSWCHVWISHHVQLLSYVDVTTIPLFYFTGKRYILQYSLREGYEDANETIQRMCDAVSASKVGAFLCCLKYSVSRHQFDSAAECNSEKWKEAVLKNPATLNVPKYKFPYDEKIMHFLLRKSEEDLAAESSNRNLKRFTAHLLHRPEELNFRLPCRLDLMCGTLTAEKETPKESSQPPTLCQDELREINPDALLYKERELDERIAQVLRQISGRNGSVSMTELEQLVSETVHQLDIEQENLLFNVSQLPELNPFLKRQPHSVCSEVILKRQKEALANMEKLKNAERSKGTNLKAIKPLFSTKTVKDLLDMHFKPDDVLKHFCPDGSYKSGMLVEGKSEHGCLDVPDPMRLRNFDEAIQMSYHGITFNIDEQAAEKFDRMCRRLVQRQVKFETYSIGSTEKVPSPATINVADSPLKQSKLITASNPGYAQQKRMQLKKVAEKLYKKRIRSQRSVKPEPLRSTMVLRSTPKKSRDEGTHDIPASLKRKKTVEVSAVEHKRQKRRTYVQDNKRRLQDLVSQCLIENGIHEGSEEFQVNSKRLYNVSMAFLRDLKSSKDLDKIMKDTVSSNVHSVLSFKTK